jgi:hypothetical protein
MCAGRIFSDCYNKSCKFYCSRPVLIHFLKSAGIQDEQIKKLLFLEKYLFIKYYNAEKSKKEVEEIEQNSECPI